MERFADKTVVITGAGDMAEVIGERILSEGGKITFADFSEEALKRTMDALKEKSYAEENILTVSCNVKSQEDCDQVIAKTIERWGKVDALVATAGIIRHLPIDEMSEKDWQDVIDIQSERCLPCLQGGCAFDERT